jgi:glutathione peroxidase
MKTLVGLSAAALICVTAAMAEPKPSLYDIPLKTLEGKPASLKEYQGKVLLIVNVASKCGYTRQYTGLEKLHQSLKGKGFTVLGFPCNDFGGQEPGTPEEIKTFCTTKYQVDFPLFEKLHVKGSEQHPLYGALTGPTSPTPGPVKWNFGKFLVGKDGTILKRFDSAVEPEAAELTKAIDDALAAK